MKKLIIILLLFIPSCYYSNYGERTLYQSTCQSPCWNGITPGSTTEQEMLKIVKALPEVNQKTFYENIKPTSVSDKEFLFYLYPSLFKQDSGQIVMRIFIKDNVVVSMSFEGNLNLSLDDVFRKFGEPTEVITSFASGDVIGLSANILNKATGYRVFVDKRFEEDDLLKPEIKIGSIEFFQPNSFIGYKHTGFVQKYQTIYPWRGFGDIYQLYPLPTP
jgi:hypothetical protein